VNIGREESVSVMAYLRMTAMRALVEMSILALLMIFILWIKDVYTFGLS